MTDAHTPRRDPAQADAVWTTRRLLAWMSDAFARAGLDAPRLSAEMLIAHVLGCDRLRLYTDTDRPATPLERDALRRLTARALRHEPVQYLVGEAWFFGLPFHADPRALIPRPSTETIVETLLQHARSTPGFGGPKGDGLALADLCTGSGCIAIALLKNLPLARAVATDISPEALELAHENAVRHRVADRLELLQGDLLTPLASHPIGSPDAGFNAITANPPYIPDHEWDAVAPNVKDHEPHRALRGGTDGLAFVKPIIDGAPRYLRHGGLLLVEIAAVTAPAVLELARAHPHLADERILDDLEGLPRVLVARREP